MTETLLINFMALTAGIALGIFFFGALWWTIQRGLGSAYPARWFFISLIVRLIITAGGFYIVANGNWQRLLLCCGGFIMVRLVLTRLISNKKNTGGSCI